MLELTLHISKRPPTAMVHQSRQSFHVIPGFSWIRCRFLGCSGGVGSAYFSGLEVRTAALLVLASHRHSGQVKAAMIPLSAGASKTGRIGTKSINKLINVVTQTSSLLRYIDNIDNPVYFLQYTDTSNSYVMLGILSYTVCNLERCLKPI